MKHLRKPDVYIDLRPRATVVEVFDAYNAAIEQYGSQADIRFAAGFFVEDEDGPGRWVEEGTTILGRLAVSST